MGVKGQLLVGLHIGDHSGSVHFRAGGRHGQHGEDRQRLFRHGLAGGEIPHIAIVAGTGGNGLGAVDHAAAAQRQHTVQFVGTAQLHALADRDNAGVGLHAAKLHPLDAVGFHLLHRTVIHAVALNAAAAVHHQHAAGTAGDLLAQLADLTLAEMNHRGDIERKILHNCDPFRRTAALFSQPPPAAWFFNSMLQSAWNTHLQKARKPHSGQCRGSVSQRYSRATHARAS